MLVLSFFESSTTVCSCCRPSSAPKEEFTVPSWPHIHTIYVASLNVTRARETLPYYVQGFRTAMRIGGGRLGTSAMFRTVRNLTDVRNISIVRLRYGNKLLTATVAVQWLEHHSRAIVGGGSSYR